MEVITKAVLIEKSPFFVSIILRNSNKEKLLVRPCVSEDDLQIARQEYRNMQGVEYKNILSFNPSPYYLVLKGGAFVGNIVSKSICQKIKYNNAHSV